ncbi:SDR family oxidoreductase [Streptomyces sp. NPDC006654]|uniref:SDR family oxidoreductase n=1 Tax=Streptomyces sp. NPDC006654 TaxID=3156897 RepID=UPI0033E0A850
MRLAEEGADVIALDSCAPVDGIAYPMATLEDLETTRDLILKTGRRVITTVVDVRERQAPAEAVEVAVNELGGLDIVVANAGVGALGRWNDIDWQQWEAVIGVNLTGTWNTLTAAIRHLLARGCGSVVAVSSAAGMVGLPYAQACAAAEHGVIGLIRALSSELVEQRIRFNAVCPAGASGTGMLQAWDGMRAVDADDRMRSAFSRAFEENTVRPSDVSSAVLYLASDESRCVTGTSMPVGASLPAF